MKSDLNYTSTSISHQYKWHWDADLSEWYYTSGFIHEALMINLIPGMIHHYQVRIASEGCCGYTALCYGYRLNMSTRWLY